MNPFGRRFNRFEKFLIFQPNGQGGSLYHKALFRQVTSFRSSRRWGRMTRESLKFRLHPEMIENFSLLHRGFILHPHLYRLLCSSKQSDYRTPPFWSSSWGLLQVCQLLGFFWFWYRNLAFLFSCLKKSGRRSDLKVHQWMQKDYLFDSVFCHSCLGSFPL